MLSTGSLVVIISFTWDFVKFMFREDTGTRIYTLTEKNIEILSYVPSEFNWWIFGIGLAVIVYGIISIIRRTKIECGKQPIY